MTLRGATLIRTEVKPGWPLTADHVQVGKRYMVDVDSVRPMSLINDELGLEMDCDCIRIVDPGPSGFFPLFALEVDKEIM